MQRDCSMTRAGARFTAPCALPRPGSSGLPEDILDQVSVTLPLRPSLSAKGLSDRDARSNRTIQTRSIRGSAISHLPAEWTKNKPGRASPHSTGSSLQILPARETR